MKRAGWHILFFTGIYFILHFCQNYALGPELVRYHFKDILLIPMLLFSIGVVSNLFNLSLPLGNKEVIIAFIYCVLAFELALPAISKHQSLDWKDIVAYALGSAIYLLFYKQTTKGILFGNSMNKKE